jgi:hypothetical protein
MLVSGTHDDLKQCTMYGYVYPCMQTYYVLYYIPFLEPQLNC